MRVALVIERFEPGGGGVEGVAWSAAGALAAAGEEVHVLCRRGEARPGVALDVLAVPTFWQPLRVLAFSRAAAARARGGRFDVVHSFSRTLHQDVFRAGGGSHADYLERSGRAGWRRLSPRHATLLAIERRVFADSSQTIQCNSAMVREQIARRYGVPDGRLVVIPNGVDLARFDPSRRGGEGVEERRVQSAGSGPIWLFAGSGFRRKGLDTALLALAADATSDAELWVAGRDAPEPWRARARELGVAERVRFLGLRSDLERLYAAADALILPTRYDAFANVCLEAAAAGIPIVTSGANGAADVLREAGMVIEDPEDSAGFAKALAALHDAELRGRLGRRGREIASDHSWARHAAALQQLYAKVRR